MRNLFILTICVGIFYACSSSPPYQEGALTLNTQKPAAGSNLTITYQSDSSALSAKKNIQGILYYLVQSEMYAKDLTLQMNEDSLLEDQFPIPDSAQAFALLFTADNQKDRNKGKGYLFPVYEDEQTVPGAYAAMGKFYTRFGEHYLGVTESVDSSLALIKKEFSLNPETKKTWGGNYLTTLARSDKEKAQKVINAAYQDSMASDLQSETMLQFFQRLYAHHVKDEERADSLHNLLLEKYPDGLYAFNKFIEPHLRSNNVDTLLNVRREAKQKFPSEVINESSLFSYLKSRITRLYVDKEQFAEAGRYIDQIEQPIRRASLYNSIAWDLAGKGKHLSFADSLSLISINLIQKELKKPANKPSSTSESQWNDRMQNALGMYADTYGYIQFKKENYEEALTWLRKAVRANDGIQSDINERYVEYELKAGSADSALSKAAKWIKEGKSTAKMDTLLLKAYTKINGSEKGFEDYKAGIQEEAAKILREQLLTQQLNKPAPDFRI